MALGSAQRGFTLLELALAVLILGIIAAAAIPSTSTLPQDKLDLAAREVAEAIRFARSESLRTGVPHGIRSQVRRNRIRVFRADMTTTPPTAIFDVYHPVSKTLFDIDLDELPFTADVDITRRSMDFRGACSNRGYLLFDTAGTPTCANPTSAILLRGVITLAHGPSTRDVVLHGFTGRVTAE